MNRLEVFMQETAADVEKRLDYFLPYADMRPEILHQAMRHSILGGGKRLRPCLVLAAFEAAGGPEPDRPRTLDAACAIELLHCYSLIHDDLPSMDNDSLRRNRLSCHKAFGEAVAILAGDALQALAFRVMAMASGPLAGPAVAELAAAAGSTGMVGGQALDIEAAGTGQTLETIEWIDRWKTGSILACCCRTGAIFAGAGDEITAALTAYGETIGVLYQISDDILDLTADVKKLGKTPGKDAVAGKLTYPAARGIEKAREMVAEKCSLAKSVLQRFGKEALYLRLLADFLRDRANPDFRSRP
ncbi:MAG: polyprenyl synthetase family protein [Planctomycetota bacterium]|jgi:geranylgeranyl diphosphate synthase type II|nr:polyprenyl synthetase family protein [Planctomycetota bacterium]